MINLTIIAGARPNFMKISPLIKAIEAKAKGQIDYRLVHTGQHYDKNMSQTFFDELGIPHPDANLGVGGGSQAEQTAGIMINFEQEVIAHRPDLVVVVGDVTSTLACSITAKKMHIPVAHIEGGIRSGDITMPEEINRMVTDSITDYFFTTSEVANANLKREGVSDDKIYFVGNTMIDTLLANIDRLKKPDFFNELGLQPKEYLVLTLHRPNNVDEQNHLSDLLSRIGKLSDIPIMFPVHPRTRQQLNFELSGNINLVDPLGYLEFNYLVKNAKGVITDSGGITEETTVMGVPCITLRDSTERPETVTLGTNELIGTNPKDIDPWLNKMLAGDWKKGSIPELWDGRTAERIVSHLLELFKNK